MFGWLAGAESDQEPQEARAVTRSGKLTDKTREEAIKKAEADKKANESNKRYKKYVKELETDRNPAQLPLGGDTPPTDEDQGEQQQDLPPQESAGNASGNGSGGSDGSENGSGGSDGSEDGSDGSESANMAVFEDDNGADDPEWYKKPVKVPYNAQDIKFWFNQLEDAMTFAGVRKQYTKRRILYQNLEQDVASEIMTLLRLNETEAGTHSYRDCKRELMRIFGPQEHDAYEKAAALTRTGKPSQLAKRLAALLCNCRPKPLQQGCCAIATVGGMWRAQLPKEVVAAIAGKSIEGENFDKVLQIADDVFKALNGPLAATSAVTPAVAATKEETLQTDVAAYTRGREYQGRGRGRSYRGGRGYGQSRGAARVHPDGPPQNACTQHKQYGKQAYYCREPLSCPWVSYVTGKAQNPQKQEKSEKT